MRNYLNSQLMFESFPPITVLFLDSLSHRSTLLSSHFLLLHFVYNTSCIVLLKIGGNIYFLELRFLYLIICAHFLYVLPLLIEHAPLHTFHVTMSFCNSLITQYYCYHPEFTPTILVICSEIDFENDSYTDHSRIEHTIYSDKNE